MSDFAGRVFIYSTLVADATMNGHVNGRIYEGIAPSSAAFPYVIFQEYAPNDVMGMGAVRLWRNDLWIVKVLDRTESFFGNIKTIATRLDTVLHRGAGTNVEGVVWACTREQPLSQIESNEGGDQIRHLGGIYRILAT